MSDRTNPAASCFNIVPGVTFRRSTGVYVGTGGNLKVTFPDGTVGTYKNVPSGMFLPIEIMSVDATSTAADIVGHDYGASV